MDFIITVALIFCVVMLALLVFRYVGLPVYRVEAVNIKALLVKEILMIKSYSDYIKSALFHPIKEIIH